MSTMGHRLELQAKLETLLGSANVYFQPPNNVQMEYPCIVYRRDDANTVFADNNPYRNVTRYEVTVIDRDPDSLIIDSIAALSLCRFDRFYTVKNLNHDVYVLYY